MWKYISIIFFIHVFLIFPGITADPESVDRKLPKEKDPNYVRSWYESE